MQFNLADSNHLDVQPGATEGWGLGFAVFGQVVNGMGAVEAISKLPTNLEGGLHMLAAPGVLFNASVVQ